MKDTGEVAGNIQTKRREMIGIIKKILGSLVKSLEEIGVSEEECEKIEGTVLQSLNDENRVGEKLNFEERGNLLDKEISEENYFSNFINKIKGVKDPNLLVSKFISLVSENKISLSQVLIGRVVSFDGLDIEICTANLGRSGFKKYNITERENKSDFSEESRFETNMDGMNQISKYCNDGWRVANKADIQRILKNIAIKYGFKSGRVGDIHDEDIAFFMLASKCYGDFLLKDSVFKCYDEFRGFKDIRKKEGTGQIILIRNK